MENLRKIKGRKIDFSHYKDLESYLKWLFNKNHGFFVLRSGNIEFFFFSAFKITESFILFTLISLGSLCFDLSLTFSLYYISVFKISPKFMIFFVKNSHIKSIRFETQIEIGSTSKLSGKTLWCFKAWNASTNSSKSSFLTFFVFFKISGIFNNILMSLWLWFFMNSLIWKRGTYSPKLNWLLNLMSIKTISIRIS